MGDTTVDVTGAGSYDEGSQGDQSQGGGNPAWKPFLDIVPQELHSQVTPLLQDWDKGVNQRFDKVHSEYADWKPFKEAGFRPQDVEFALNLANALQQNPREVYDTLGTMYKFNGDTATGNQQPSGQGQGESSQEDQFFDPRYDDVKHQVDLMANVLLRDRSEREYQAQVDAENAAIEKELSDMRKKYGDFNEQDVLHFMAAGMSTEDAVKRYQAIERTHAPKHMFATGGGGLPNPGQMPKNMTDTQTNAYVAQMLEQAMREGRQ